MSWTTVLRKACENAVMVLELWLDEHFNMVERLVRSLIADGCPHHNDPTPGPANLGDLLDITAIQNRDCETGEHPVSNERQVALRPAQCSKIFAAAIADLQWRLTRHTIRSELPEGRSIQIAATANFAEG